VLVVKAQSASEALQLAARVDVDVVLADYHLGDGINGLELLHRLQHLEDSPLAAALITADHGAEVALMARAAGYPLLHKPLRPAALRALLSAFRRSRKRAAADIRYLHG
jgi:DNA-binding response OmpR family regulator